MLKIKKNAKVIIHPTQLTASGRCIRCGLHITPLMDRRCERLEVDTIKRTEGTIGSSVLYKLNNCPGDLNYCSHILKPLNNSDFEWEE